ncbi:MAG TPA: hypothetical protein VEJ42_01030 [Streptosporangiaceae bacterium]|nr:hypothetical protein [Streptosporangiaceae bacterium]
MRPAATRTLMAALVCACCWAGPAPAFAATRPHAASSASPASPAACYAVAVSALRRQAVVRRTPPACAGLGAVQINQAVGRAIRTVVGPLPRAAARRRALAESRYLASLVRQARPPGPVPVTTAASAASHPVMARLAALAAWLAAALAGGYLLAGRRRPRGHRRLRIAGLAGAHAGLAASGLCVWVAYILTLAPALGWIDVALTWVIVGLGMATLLADPAVKQAETMMARQPATPTGPALAAPAPARNPVLIIALHGTLATTTIVLVLIAVIGAG